MFAAARYQNRAGSKELGQEPRTIAFSECPSENRGSWSDANADQKNGDGERNDGKSFGGSCAQTIPFAGVNDGDIAQVNPKERASLRLGISFKFYPLIDWANDPSGCPDTPPLAPLARDRKQSDNRIAARACQRKSLSVLRN